VNARRVYSAASVVHAAMQSRQTAAGIAAALEAECLLQSPETAAEQRETAAALRDTLGALLETQVERDVLAARVAELEAERHSTNEALSKAAEQLRANRDRIAESNACLACGEGLDDENISDFCSDRCERSGAPATPPLPAEVLAERYPGSREDRFVSPLHTDYRTPHDLPPATNGPGVTS
jgi:DNA repair exonuclease SbcCD ATPase subunit